MNLTFKVIKDNKTIRKCRTHSKRRFLNQLRTINWRELRKNKPSKVYLRVYYGRFIDNFGKKPAFYNDGFYTKKKDLWLAWEAFSAEKS